MEYIIDAKDKTIGRVATEAAKVLMGKNQSNYKSNERPKLKVTISNASKLKISERKRETKSYIHFTGYPSGQKSLTLKQLLAKHGYEGVLMRAVRGMIPDNRLLSDSLKQLEIKD